MLNAHCGTKFTPRQVREVVNEIKRIRPGRPRYKVPKENWICPRHFGIHCFDYQRPEDELLLARQYFVGTHDQLRCCSHQGVTSGSDSDRASGEFPDPYPTRKATQEVETSSATAMSPQAARIRKLSILLAFTVISILLYYSNIIRQRHRWPSTRGHTLEAHHRLASLKAHLQTNLDRPYLFQLYCLLFLLLLGKTNTCLSSLSPITLQPLNPPSTTTPPNGPPSYKKWFSNHFPYFFLRNPTTHHRSLTLSNLLIVLKSFLHDAFHTTVLFIFFYIGWLASKLIVCQHTSLTIRNTREQLHVHSRGISKELFSFIGRCPFPNLRPVEFKRAGAVFMVCRYMFMVFFWAVAAIPDVVERFQVGYRGE